MPEDRAIPVPGVLRQEYVVLRPESGYETCDEAGLFAKVHSEKQPLSALCISGGGIRSATFALGAIQELAGQGVLGTFDYLSTVSGGGYIGAWLTSWKQRAGGIGQVIPYLRRKAPPTPPGEPNPIEHLREYNSYLSPRLGLLSADSWTLGAIVGRNMLLNWLVFIPLLMAALLVPRLTLSLARLGEAAEQFYGFSPYSWGNVPSDVVIAISALLFAVAVCNTLRYLPGVGRTEHSQGDFLMWVLLPLILSALAFNTNDSWFTGGDATKKDFIPQLLTYPQIAAGSIASACGGWLAYLLFARNKGSFRTSLRIAPALLFGGWMGASAAWLLADRVYPSTSWAEYITIATPLLLTAVVLAGCLFVGVSSRILEDEDREWLSRAGAWVLLYIVSWSSLSALVLLAPDWVLSFPVWGKSLAGAAGVAGGWISSLAGSSSKTVATKSATGPQKPSLIARLALALAAPVFVVALIVGLSIATDWLLQVSRLGAATEWWNHKAMLEGTRTESVLLLGVVFLAFSRVMAHFVNINKFSLHAMYRNRLIRAYLGASNPRRNASKFTGFAESDNTCMHALDPTSKPLHIVNVTLNLVAGQRLAWQQRKAESFTISPLHCGSAELGYRPSTGYGGPDGISLGTAITISGAAASPNMGYHSSPVIGFIMTLFNARLGSWLGNPGPAGDKTWRKSGPTSAVGSLVNEAFGLTNDTNEWVYLSDGGHFENLALYEMVRRRCRYIVVLDGGCDADFTYGDLGNALRKIRIDFKIPIQFEETSYCSLREKQGRWAVARICYTAVDDPGEDGYLIYVKPMIRGNEPPDVASYCCDHPAFPHESTADQFFNESQTESYRALGAHTIAEICRGWDGAQGLPGLTAYLVGRSKAAAAIQ